MQDEPTPTELVQAVADFLRTDIAPLIALAGRICASAQGTDQMRGKRSLLDKIDLKAFLPKRARAN